MQAEGRLKPKRTYPFEIYQSNPALHSTPLHHHLILQLDTAPSSETNDSKMSSVIIIL